MKEVNRIFKEIHKVYKSHNGGGIHLNDNEKLLIKTQLRQLILVNKNNPYISNGSKSFTEKQMDDVYFKVLKDDLKFIVFIQIVPLSLVIGANLLSLILPYFAFDYHLYWLLPVIVFLACLFAIYVLQPIAEWWFE